MTRPFVVIGASMFLSLFVMSYLGIPAAVIFFVVAVTVSLPSFICRKRNRIWKTALCVCLSVMSASLLFSVKTVSEYEPALEYCDDAVHTVVGTLEESEPAYEKHQYYTLSDVIIDGVQTAQTIRVNSPVLKDVETDDILVFSNATVYELGASSGANLAYKADGVYLGVYSSENFSVMTPATHTVSYYLDALRNYITDTLNEYMYPEYAAITNALLTGDGSDVDYDTSLDFSYSGISHLFAVSGFHLSLWTSLLAAVLDKILKRHKAVSNIISMLFVVFFMALTGFSVSVTRAGIMLLIALFGRLIKYRADSLNSLFVALTVILTLNPFAVSSLSLQLSFLATFGIILLADTVSEPVAVFEKMIKNKFLGKTVSALYTTVAISVVATLFTMPVSAVHFGCYSPAAPLTNLLCMAPSQILMPLAGIGVCLSPVSFLAKPIFTACNFLVRYILAVTSYIGHKEYFVTDTTYPTSLTAVLLVIAVFAVLLVVFYGKNKKLRILIACTASVVLMISVVSESVLSDSYAVSVASVGNGTSVVLDIGNKNIMIGCGGADHLEYSFTNTADKTVSREFDLILIPRSTETEMSYAYSVFDSYAFDSCIVADEEFPKDLQRRFPENTVVTNDCSVTLDENTILMYVNNENFSGARIEGKNFSATVLFRPSSDLSCVDPSWLSGDLLVTRQKLPDADISGFDKIIVSTSSEYVVTDNKIYSTQQGNIKFTSFPWGGVSVYADK